MSLHCNALVENHHPLQYPVRVSSVAAGLGLIPEPLYRRVSPGMADGSLDVISGRIVIRTKNGGAPTDGKELLRTRFTYAHEVAHVLFYSTARRPLERLAPPVLSDRDKTDEERLCNRGARTLLMPDRVMETVAGQPADASPRLLHALMQAFQVNLEPAAYRLHEWTAHRAGGDRFWMVSKKDQYGGVPRCTVCMIPAELADPKSHGLRFLAGNQPLNRILPLVPPDSKRWSALSYILDKPGYGWDTPAFSPNDEILRTRSHVVRLRSRHMWLKWGSMPTYVWTEGTIQVEEDLRKRRTIIGYFEPRTS